MVGRGDWKDPWATNWEHTRDFHENCYNWNKFLSCSDFFEVPKATDNSECYINYTFDNCGQNYCWVYKGASYDNEIDLWEAEDCLETMIYGYWGDDANLYRRAWAMNE